MTTAQRTALYQAEYTEFRWPDRSEEDRERRREERLRYQHRRQARALKLSFVEGRV